MLDSTRLAAENLLATETVEPPLGEHGSSRNICLHLCDIVWMATFQHYYWTNQERQKKQNSLTK